MSVWPVTSHIRTRGGTGTITTAPGSFPPSSGESANFWFLSGRSPICRLSKPLEPIYEV
jgi:hypothetical protein